MKKIFLFIVVSFFAVKMGSSQNITITDNESYTADTSAMLDVQSLTKGMLVPRLTTDQREAIYEPATGLLVFDTDSLSFFFFNGSSWINLSHGNASNTWKISSNKLYISDDYKVGINQPEPLSTLEVKANASALSTDPLFKVINKGGDTVFAVYPDGVRINFDESTKGNIGGFAVSGRSATKGLRDYLRVTADSTRIYLNETLKGNIGGFAVSGRSATKGAYDEFLRVTPDSTRVYVNKTSKGNIGGFAVSGRSATKGAEEPMFVSTFDSTRVYVDQGAKGNIGGFAVSGRSATKQTVTNFMDLTPENYFIGHESGLNCNGILNSFYGYQTGYTIANIDSSVLIGYKSGYSLDANNCDNNIYIGYMCGYESNGNYNTVLGSKAFYQNNSGNTNVAIGYEAMKYNLGNDNIAIGHKALTLNDGADNVAIGSQALESNNGNRNIAIGEFALNSNDSGDDNIALGDNALNDNQSGEENIAIGRNSLANNVGGNNNIALGKSILGTSENASGNIGIGDEVLLNVLDDSEYNIGIGYQSGEYCGNNSDNNIFMGYRSGNRLCRYSGQSGDNNVFLGYHAGYYLEQGNDNIFIGSYSGGESSNDEEMNDCVFIGNEAHSNCNESISNSMALGYDSEVNVDNKVVIGNSSVTSIGGYAGWSVYSDKRLKENIVYTNTIGLDFIMRLKTASYNYKNDKNKTRRDGLIAQDVQKAMDDLNISFSGLVVDNDLTKTMNLSYQTFVVPLINSVQEQQEVIENQQQEIEALKEVVNKLLNKMESELKSN